MLLPGGQVIAIERQVSAEATGPASHGWTEDQAESFATLCRDTGFTDVCVEGRGTGKQAVWVVRGTRR